MMATMMTRASWAATTPPGKASKDSPIRLAGVPACRNIHIMRSPSYRMR